MTFSKLGTDIDTQQIVELSQASRRQGLYIIGANGTGKTGLIEHLILQDIDQGLGVGLLDPHGDLTNAILAKMTKREDDVILLDIQDEDHPFGLNLFECPNPQSNTAVQKIVDLVMHIFEKLYDVSRQTPRMAQFLRNCTHTLVANPGYTMADIPLLLQVEQCRKKLVANVTDPKVRLFWQTYEALKPSEQFDRAESTINKLDELLQPLTSNIVGQAHTTVNIQQVMDERKILLVKLSAQLDQVTSLVGTLFIALFLNAAYSRASIPINKRKQFNLYADEFQRFATEDFATLLTEARKFGIATTIAHQARYQPGMTDGIRAVSLQAANHIVFRVTSPDADELAGEFDTTPPPPKQEEAGRRKKQTPGKNVVKALLDGGQHKSDVVNQFIYGTLRDFKTRDEQQRYQYAGKLNELLFQAMIGKDIAQISIDGDMLRMLQNLSYESGGGASYMSPANPTSYATVIQALKMIWSSQQNSWQYRQALQTLHNQAVSRYRAMYLSLLTGTLGHVAYDQLRKGDKNYTPIVPPEQLHTSWYYIEPSQVTYKVVQVLKAYDHVGLVFVDTPELDPPNQETKFYREYDLIQMINMELQQEEAKFLAFMIELKQVMQALAANPILVDSGEEEVIYRPGPVRPYQDIKNDIANQLSGLPNFTARVKIGDNAPQNPGKKCLKCGQQANSGAKFCQKCGTKLPAPNEYTFTTLKPLGGIGKAALQQRLTTIQANNLQKGYVRDRTTVEAEIIKRQNSCSGAAPAQPQKPLPQQARHARQVPVQGKCSKCGAVNSSNAKFCNQCGAKL